MSGIRFSIHPHFAGQTSDRGISIIDCKNTVRNPDYSESHGKKWRYYKVIGGKRLKVVAVKQKKNNILLITAVYE